MDFRDEVTISGNYKVIFLDYVQVNTHDTCKQRRVIRRQMDSQDRITRMEINNHRLGDDAIPKVSFGQDTDFQGCKFIVDWFEMNICGKKKNSESEVVGLAIDGIWVEADIYPDRRKAVQDVIRFVKQLLQVQLASIHKTHEVYVRLYTEDSFLYHMVNKALREEAPTKLETMGPFYYLLYNYTGSAAKKQGQLPKKIELYRGERLSPDIIEAYENALGKNNI